MTYPLLLILFTADILGPPLDDTIIVVHADGILVITQEATYDGTVLRDSYLLESGRLR